MLSFLFKAGGWKVSGGLYLGWGIGANDSANVFGTAVATNSVRYRTAVIIIAIFVILGSVLGGPQVIYKVKFSEDMGQSLALIAAFAGAIAVTIVTILGIPASTSQAAIGGIMGTAIFSAGWHAVDWNNFGKMFICWVATPIGSAIVTIVMYTVFSRLINRFVTNMIFLDRLYKFLLLTAGAYGAYSLGANNVSVTTAGYFHAGMFGDPMINGVLNLKAARIACLIGGVAIALGALTYSKKVMETVGSKITILDPFSAVITVFAHSIALSIFTKLGVPVSSSQAIVGSVIGIGLIKGVKTIQARTLVVIFVGWLMTPISGAIAAYLLAVLFI